MGRPPGTLHLLLCLTLLPSISVATSAQNVAPSEYKLQVISAKYLADKDVIQYKLVNTGNNPVTAFSAEISAEVGGRDAIRNGGPVDWRRDLLYGELFLQCQNAPENADEEDVNPFANPIQVKGTIKPGQTYIQDLPGSLYLDKDSLQLGFPTIHVVITGIMWSVGTMEGTKAGIGDMRQFRDWRHEASLEWEEVLAVLKAHLDDEDSQHRINETIKDLKSLLVGYPREIELPEDESGTMYVGSQGNAEAMIRNLDEAAFLSDPRERYKFLFEFGACTQDRAKELQRVKPVAPLKSRHKHLHGTCPKAS